jgi:hypothetical protein
VEGRGRDRGWKEGEGVGMKGRERNGSEEKQGWGERESTNFYFSQGELISLDQNSLLL